MQLPNCPRHPNAWLVSAGGPRGEQFFICLRCSHLLAIRQGVIHSLDWEKGVGTIRADYHGVGEKNEDFLFSLAGADGFEPKVGRTILFEAGLVRTEESDYAFAASHLVPVSNRRDGNAPRCQSGVHRYFRPGIWL